MSQNKTVIQGLEPENNFGGSSNGAGSNNFYSRSNRRSSSHDTYVPGMERSMGQMNANMGNEQSRASQAQKTVQPGKPIVGFLYSVSRTRFGECWPILLGKNTIGQSADNDIQLLEGTVSSNHAVLLTRQGKDSLIAAIKDDQSTNGTMINGQRLDFGAEECHDGDIITIGNNYEFVLVLIDVEKRGLKVAEQFIPVEENAEDEDFDEVDAFQGGTTRPGDFDPYNDGPTAWGSGGYSRGTVGMDGSVSGGNHGETIPM